MFPVWVSSAIVPGAVALRDGLFDPITFVLEALLCYLLLALSCWADELGDLDHGVDNDDRVGPVRPLQRGEISRREMMLACAALSALCILDGVSLIIWSCLRNPVPMAIWSCLVAAGFCFVWLAISYTVGERPYGYLGLGDIVAFFCFGPIACVGGYWLYSHRLDPAVLLPACAIGLLLASTINLQNIRDMENDRSCGKMTLAVKLGRRGAVVYQLCLVIGAMSCYLAYPFVEGDPSPLICLLALGMVPLATHCVRFVRLVGEGDPSRLDSLMWPLTRGMMIACLCFCAYAVSPALS